MSESLYTSIAQEVVDDLVATEKSSTEDQKETDEPTQEPKPEDPKEQQDNTVVDIVIDQADAVNKTPNSFASKKSVAQRMMDIALLTSNANQLRYVLAFGTGTAYYYVSLVLIVLSLILQVAVGIFMIFKSKPRNSCERDRANNIIVSGVLTITVINVLNTAFSIEGTEAKKPSNFTSYNNTI